MPKLKVTMGMKKGIPQRMISHECSWCERYVFDYWLCYIEEDEKNGEYVCMDCCDEKGINSDELYTLEQVMEAFYVS